MRLRAAIPSVEESLLAAAAIALFQLAFAALMAWRTRPRRGPASARRPRVSVIVPCSGELPEARDNLRSLLAQEYRGELEFLFVTPGPGDPALPLLRELAASRPGVRVLSPVLTNERCTAKARDMVHAVAQADPRSEVLAFFEDKSLPPPGALDALVRALERPGAGVSTMLPLPYPEGGDLTQLLQSAWMLAGTPFLYAWPLPCGLCYAMRRRDYESWGMAERWSRAFADDASLGLEALSRGRSVEIVSAPAVLIGRRVPLSRLPAVAARYFLSLKVHAPALWLAGSAFTALKGLLAARAFVGTFEPALLAAVIGADALYLAASAAVTARRQPDWEGRWSRRLRPIWLWAAAAAPAVWLLQAWSCAATVFRSGHLYRGKFYLVRGPYDVRALAPAPRLSKIVAAAAVAGGALWGLAYRPSTPLLGWLAWPALAVLPWALHSLPPRRAFLVGWLFGTCAWIAAMGALAPVLAEYMRLPLPGAVLVSLLLCALGGLSHAFLGASLAWTSPRLAGRFGVSLAAAEAAVFAPLFVALEGWFPRAFPDFAAITQHFHPPALQSAELFGTAALSVLMSCFAAALVFALRSGRGSALAAALAAAALNEGYGRLRIPRVEAELSAAPAVSVAVIQAALGNERRWDRARLGDNLEAYNSLMRGARAELMIWPQNSYERRFSFRRGDAEMTDARIEGAPPQAALRLDLAPVDAELLMGGIGEDDPPGARGYYVSVLARRDRTIAGISSKRLRTPLAEALPFEDWFPSLRRVAVPRLGLILPGPARVLETSSGAKLGVYVCYESLLDAPARYYAQRGAELLVNLAAGDSVYPRALSRQFAAAGAIRAVENRRFIVRASEHSMIVDPVGRIVAELEPAKPGVLRYDVPRLRTRPPSLRLGGALYALAAVAAGAIFLLSYRSS